MKNGAILCIVLLAAMFPVSVPADSGLCLECHGEKELTAERGGRSVSMYIDGNSLARSVHKDHECTSCHTDVDVENLPHPERLQSVQCGACHDAAQEDFSGGIHGRALMRQALYAPTCTECHGAHEILPSSDSKSKTYKMNVPFLCGSCHREGAPVARTYDIGEHNILQNYSQSIHGEGLFKKGLLVTAGCTDCHRSHRILPHTDPKSSVSPLNIAGTCTQCHIKIEEVHQKIISGELWESKPGTIPACSDCHLAHKVRKESLALTLSDQSCMKCHEQTSIHAIAGGDTSSMYVDKEIIAGSVHQEIPCVKCHSDINPHARRPCETASRADCSNCHAQAAEEYEASGHGQHARENDKNVPLCTTCHGDHKVKSAKDETSPTFRSAIPTLCGECHRSDGKASTVPGLLEVAAFSDYSTSVHGQSLVRKGLLPSAVCTDCHNSHFILKHTDERSSIYNKNIPSTCATCHRGIFNQYTRSIHFSADARKMERLPICTQCHSSHTITDVGQDEFITEVTLQCGTCHKELAKTYLQTMHGKAYHLGYLKAAKCSDCHDPHMTLAISDPGSSVGLHNIVTTCKKCHEDANYRFTGYLTHATHHDKVKYPILFYTYWTMTLLLTGVFLFFGLHTLLWLPRSFRNMLERRKRSGTAIPGRYFIKRFTAAQRITHLFVITSFMSLALTGMMLKFSSMPWAQFIANLLGGVAAAGTIHRTAAVMTFGYFIYHISALVGMKRARRVSWRKFIFDRQSMMFNMTDLRDFMATMRWFFGRGPRPDYGRWTYWEKFDYFAVFWGVGVIGLSGLMLWFPEFFTMFLPGRFINVATIIHSDEALLAVGFIFTIHFFNTHLRPEAFPMDKVIFTGSVPLEEFKHDRPREYDSLKKSGMLRKQMHANPPSERLEKLARIFGFTFLGIGILLIGLIIYSVLFGYR